MTPARLAEIRRHVERMRHDDDPVVPDSLADAMWNEDLPELLAAAEALMDREEKEALDGR